MRKSVAIVVMFLCLFLNVEAQEQLSLRFNDDGEFKIVQFTDTHYKWGKKASNAATECMREVLDLESPDFVIITGDLVYSKSVDKSLPVLLDCIIQREIPFAIIMGNHDGEFDMSLNEIYDRVQSMPYCVMPERHDDRYLDYALAIRSNDGSRIASVMYCFDTHAGAKVAGIGGYDWIRYDQVGWYRNQSELFAATNNGNPLPALAFMHIPVPEYAYAEGDDKAQLLGTKGENVCCPKLNSGLFTSFCEKGDVMAAFCGHDHDNDFAVMHHGIMLAYGRYSGGNTVYNHLKPNGARVIVLKEDARELDSWLRLRGGKMTNRLSYPGDLTR